MFEDLLDSIESGFSNLVPSNFCLPCFLKGLAEGAVIGFATLALIASAPAWLAVALAVGLAALGAYGIYQLVNRWPQMSDDAKSEALGGIAGGLIAGRFGPRIPPASVRVPTGVGWLTTPEGVSVPVVVTAPVVTTAPAIAGAAAAPALGVSGAAMMSTGGGGGSGSGDDGDGKVKGSKQEPPKTTADSVSEKLDRYLLNKDHPVGRHKAEFFEKALGFTKENSKKLADQLVFDPTRATQTEITEFGTKYNQVINVGGENGRTVSVKVAWIRNNDGVVRIVTAVPGD